MNVKLWTVQEMKWKWYQHHRLLSQSLKVTSSGIKVWRFCSVGSVFITVDEFIYLFIFEYDTGVLTVLQKQTVQESLMMDQQRT